MEIIAEIGSNWLNPEQPTSDNQAHTLIEEAARAGATIVKFQVLRADTLYSWERAPEQHQRVRCYELPLEWLPALQRTAHSCGVKLWASVFHPTLLLQSVSYLDGVKIASGDLTYQPLVALSFALTEALKLPLALSTGAATWTEIAGVMNSYRHDRQRETILMHCVSAYPADPSIMNLATLRDFRLFSAHIGFSDHTLGCEAAPLALALGAEYFEKHFRGSSEDRRSPDWGVSLSTRGFSHYVAALQCAEIILGSSKRGGAQPVETEKSERVWARRNPKDWLRPNLEHAE